MPTAFRLRPLLILPLLLLCPRAEGKGPAEASSPRLPGALARRGSEFGLELYSKLKEADKNLVVSPYSVSEAFAMLMQGARGSTSGEIAKAFRYPSEGEALAKDSAELSRRLKGRAAKDGLVFEEAFALCLAKLGFIVAEPYKRLLQDLFGADVLQVRDVAPVNAWAEKKTRGLVKGLLKSLPPSALCVLLNAVYFKGEWAAAFDPQETEQTVFSTTKGRKVRVRMMRQTGPFRILRDEAAGFSAIDLPYRGGSFSMVVFLPEELSGLKGFEASLSPRRVEEALRRLDGLEPVEVELGLPRFKLARRHELIPSLKALGLSRVFDAKAADLSGIGGKPGEMAVSQVAHKAFLEVDEKGSEAAAATAIDVELSAPARAVPFNADHPFFFLIREKETSAILFVGRLADPSQKEE